MPATIVFDTTVITMLDQKDAHIHGHDAKQAEPDYAMPTWKSVEPSREDVEDVDRTN